MIWCFHCQDKPDGLPIRQANRDAHLAYIRDFDIRVAGPLLNEAGDMAGSCLLVELSDRSAAEAFAANDPYAKAGLFESVVINEFKTVVWPE